jgi:hypothetical protein
LLELGGSFENSDDQEDKLYFVGMDEAEYIVKSVNSF